MTGPTRKAMAAERRRQEEAVANAAALAEFGLTPDSLVRFRKSSRTWVEGRPLSVNADGSICLFAGGALRAKPAAEIEVLIRGPRGGRHWVALLEET